MQNSEFCLCNLLVNITGTDSFVNRYTWSPKDLSSEKSWYVFGHQSLGSDDSPGKKTLNCYCNAQSRKFVFCFCNESGRNPEIMKLVKAQVLFQFYTMAKPVKVLEKD
jgi:hypothetical protein